MTSIHHSLDHQAAHYIQSSSTGKVMQHHDHNRQIYKSINGCKGITHNNNNPLTAIIQINLCQPATPVKNWRILLEQGFTAMLLLMATSKFIIGRRQQSSP